MQELKESLIKLLQSNTLLGGAIPPSSNIFQQLEAISQFGYPFMQFDGSGSMMFSSSIWDNVDRYPVQREVFGVEQFRHRTQLLLDQMGNPPYNFEVIRKYKPIGLQCFPESKTVFMPKTFNDPTLAMEIVRDFVKVTDTTLVVRLEGLNKLPVFSVQSVFNPYFAYFRQREKDICVSPDLICYQATQSKPLLEHKDQEKLQTSIRQGFSPIVGLSIMPPDESTVTCLPSGYPYPDKDITPVQEQEKQKADPSNFEL